MICFAQIPPDGIIAKKKSWKRSLAMKWFSVTETQPKNGERVLLYTPYGFFGEDHSCIGDLESISTCCATISGKTVPIFTHWMPLPQMPGQGQIDR
jgi:hypothetical protein